MSGVGTDTARRAATSERRQITVLFADIAGSTAIAERMDPEDWTVIVGQAFALMNRTIEQYGGTIARLMGDGVLVFFGAPVAHEDDPERAVRCGLDMVREIAGLGGEEHARHGVPLQVRVGINTGPVVVGLVGSDIAREYTAVGDAVNIADLVRSGVGVGPTADEPEVREVLERRCRELFGDVWSDTYAYLGHLLSIRLEPELRARVAALEIETIKRYTSSILKLIQALAT